MSLKGKKPETVSKRLKGLFFGPSGVGKTMPQSSFLGPTSSTLSVRAENDEYTKAPDRAKHNRVAKYMPSKKGSKGVDYEVPFDPSA